MNNFGLGLIISCTDNATSGLRSVTGAFNDLNNTTAAFSQANGVEAALMQISVAAGIVGNELYQVGKSITGMFTSVIKSITDTGATVNYARTQLSTLYGSAEAGNAKLAQIQDYAKKSIFDFESLIPSVIMLKANGIEAFEEIATSSYLASDGVEGAKATLMDYASALAAFNPQMKNAYGTGVQAAMGALNEYIAEGNAMSLKRGASLDITALLGEDKGESIEERSRQVADLIDQLNMLPIVKQMENNPMTMLSNMGDTLFSLKAQISDAGVYEKFTEIIGRLSEYLGSIPEEELENLAQVIGSALTSVMGLLDPVIDGIIKLADAVRNLVKTNPELAQTIIKFTAFAGVAVLLTGVGLKLVSALGMLRFSISMLFKGSETLSGGAKLLGVFRNLFTVILPLVALSALLKAAWDRDFLGMRDNVTNALKTIINTFRLVADAFTDNTLSAENFQKAKDMGILPLIEGILQLKYHWQFFVDGFKKGLDAFFESLKNVLTQLGILDVDVSSFGELIVALIDKMTAPGMTDTWEKVGYFIGKAAGWIAVAIVMLPVVIKSVKIILGTIKTIVTVGKAIWNTIKIIWNVLKIVWNVVKTIYNGVKWIVNLISKIPWGTILSGIQKIGTLFKVVFGGIKTAILWVIKGIGSIITTIATALGLPAWVVGLIIAAIVALIALVIIFWDEIKAFFINLGTAIAGAFSKAWEWFSNLPWVQAVIGFVQGIIQAVKDAVSKVIQAIMPILEPIIGIIKTIISTIISIAQSVWSIIQSIAGIIWTVISTIISVISTAAQAIWSVIMTIFNVIKGVVMSIWGVICSVVNLIKNIIYAIYQVIRTIVLAVIAVFKILWDGISAGLSFIYNLFATIFSWIYENVISPVVEAIGTAFSWVYNNVISPVIEAIGTAFTWLKDNVITPVCDFFKSVFETIAEKAEWLKEKFDTVFGAIKGFITGAIEKARDIVMPIIETIGGAIQGVIDGISWVIDNVADFFGGVGDFFGGIGDGISDFIGLDTGGYVKETGVACLHPNEVVVNDVLTKRLGTFLSDYNSAKTTSSPLIKQDIVATDDYTDEDNPINPTPVIVPPPTGDGDNGDSPMQSLVNNTTNNNTYDESSSDDNRTQDNSVTFEAGSIVFNIDKDTDLSDEGLDALADKLMKKMSRKMQLRNMQTRT